MYLYFYIFPVLLFIPFTVYIYFYFKRIAKLTHFDTQQTKIKVTVAILSVLFISPARQIFGVWAVVVGYLLAFAIMMDIVYGISRIFKVKNQLFQKIYQSGVIPILCVLLVLGYGYIHMKDVVVKEYNLYTTKSITKDYKIALISDLHFGNTMNQKELEKYCLEISQYQVDIVILAGDIVDEKTSKKEMKEAFSTLGKIQSTYGLFYVYGNHDKALYSEDPHFDVDDLNQVLRSSGITNISDQNYMIHNDMILIGRDDVRNPETEKRQDAQILKENLDDNAFLLLVDHQPIELQSNSQLGYDLQLSGHTHGGQMFPVGLMTDILGFGEMNYGYKKVGDMQVIVSSGIAGWGYPLRTGSQSEYVIINLKHQS